MNSFSLQVHPDAAAWVPSRAIVDKLKREFPYPWVTLRIWPRRMVGQVTGKVGLPSHAFRARSIENVADVFVDPTETKASISWLMAHELAHHQLKTTPALLSLMDSVRPDLPKAGDAFHDYDTQESWCDNRATEIFGDRLDREWWRARTP